MPEQFWHLTVREFYIKHAAFARAEDRRRALVLEQALVMGHGSKKQQLQLEKSINALRRYPLKAWLLNPP